jgi:NAD(P)-dependent dehydrogenase (short-subunit alcohol dehydrogenase family)
MACFYSAPLAWNPTGVDITAGGEGIGKATARLLAHYGADIVLAGRTEQTLRATAAEIAGATGRKCIGIPTDARDEAQVKRLFAQTVEEFGRIDILINGVGWSTNSALSKMDFAVWKGDFERNVDSAFLCTREAGQYFLPQKSGAIVNISSMAGVNGVKGKAAYSAAKAAMQMLTRVSAAEWGPHGIRVNCVAPGLIVTDNGMKAYDAAGMDVNAFCLRYPLQRPGTAEDIARAAVFFAANASSYVTGETMAVTGGPMIGGSGD